MQTDWWSGGELFGRSKQALLARDNVRRQCADRDGVKRRSSSSVKSSDELGAETSITPANVQQDGRAAIKIVGALGIWLRSSLSQARRARGPLCRSTAAPVRSAADRTEMSQVGQTRFAQSPSARDSERSSARQGLRKARTKLPIAAAQPRRLQEVWSQPAREGSMPTIPPANPYQTAIGSRNLPAP
jgi:hypothetical protein